MAGMFRPLRADELECRVQSIKSNGLILLLYKDARADQNILDETVGPMNWQRSHNRDNANCIVSIWDNEKEQWISKEDTGTESNTESIKGLASDSFKRACFNWGIGRELYTAPFTWIPANCCKIANGKCYDKFKVKEIEYTNGAISRLVIDNTSQRCECFHFERGKAEGAHSNALPPTPQQIEPQRYAEQLSFPQTNQPAAGGSARPSQGGKILCSGCGSEVNEKVYKFSMQKFGRCLCYSCQKRAK